MTIEQIIDAFCESRAVEQSEIFLDVRKENIVATRYMIWHYLHHKLNWSGGRISRRFKRNIPSVFRGLRVIKNDMRHNRTLGEEYKAIVKKIEEAETTPS